MKTTVKFLFSTLVAAAAMTSTAWAEGTGPTINEKDGLFQVTEGELLLDSGINTNTFVVGKSGYLAEKEDSAGEFSVVTAKGNSKISGTADTATWVGLADNTDWSAATKGKFVLNITGEGTVWDGGSTHIANAGQINVTDNAKAEFSYTKVRGGLKVDNATVKIVSQMNVYGEENYADGDPSDKSDVLLSMANFEILNGADVDISGALVVGKNGNANRAGKITIADKSNVSVGGTLTIYSGSGIEVNGSSFKAGTVVNNGSFTVSGDSQIVAASYSGNIINVVDSATLTDSKIGGGLAFGYKQYLDSGKQLTFKGDSSVGTLYIGNKVNVSSASPNYTNGEIHSVVVEGNLTVGTLNNRATSKTMVEEGASLVVGDTVNRGQLIVKGSMTIDTATAGAGTGHFEINEDDTDSVSASLVIDGGTFTDASSGGYIAVGANGGGASTDANAYMELKNNANFTSAGTVYVANGAGNYISVSDSKFHAGNVVNNGSFTVAGNSSLNIATLTGEAITFLDGAIIKDSTVGGGVFVAGNVTFRGQNTFAMLYDYGTLTDYYGTTAPMAWTVEKGASLVLTDKARYGLGYGDNVTVNGGLTDAKSARESLTEADCSLFMHGLVAQESKGWNCSSKFTVKDAYAVIGSNNSFGNKPGNYGGSYEFYFENSVLDASRITFYEALSKTTFTFKDCDVKLGTFMTRDKDSVFTLDNTKLLSTTTTNGNDEGNYNAGTLNVSNGSELTYSAEVKNEGGTINVIGSTFVAPKIENKGTFTVVGNSTVKFNTLTSAGEIIYLGKADGERSKISLGSVDGVATITYDKANQKSASVYAYNSDVSLSSDLIYDNNSGNYANAYLYFNNSTLDLGDGKTLTLKGGKLITRGLVITGKGTFVVEDSTHSPCWQESGNSIGKDVTLLSNTAANFYGDTTIYGTVNFALNTGNSDLVGSTYAGFEESATAKLTISGGNYTTKNGFVVTTKTNELNVVDAGTVLINKTLANNGVVTVGAGSTLTANAITGSGDVKLAGTITVIGGVFKADELTIVAGATLNFGAAEKGVTLMATREVISFDFNTLTIVTDKAVVAGEKIQLDDIITGSGADEIWNALAGKGESTEFTVVDSEGKTFTGVYNAGGEGSQGSISVIPEPSMFGLFAGLGALLLVGTRRRRR